MPNMEVRLVAADTMTLTTTITMGRTGAQAWVWDAEDSAGHGVQTGEEPVG